MREFGTINRKLSIAAKMLAFVLLLSGTGISEAETLHIVPLDRSESIHQYSDPFQTVLAVQENDALQVVVLGNDLPPDPSLEVRRAFLEITIPNLTGMLTVALEVSPAITANPSFKETWSVGLLTSATASLARFR